MNSEYKCPIWGTDATFLAHTSNGDTVVDSPKVGGKYCISFNNQIELNDITGSIRDDVNKNITCYLEEQRKHVIECPMVPYIGPILDHIETEC